MVAASPEPKLVAPRKEDEEYDVTHWNGAFYILTNADGAVDFKVVKAPIDNPGRENWEDVTSRSGRVVSEALPDILTGYTPDPLYPAEADQTHYWWATWQAVGPQHQRTSLPLGTYRLHVEGMRFIGGAETWPWPTEPYELSSSAFELLPGEITLQVDTDGLWVSLRSPEDGYRMVHIDGQSRGDNPVDGPLELSSFSVDGLIETLQLDPAAPSGHRSWLDYKIPSETVSITVTDAAGNTGSITL